MTRLLAFMFAVAVLAGTAPDDVVRRVRDHERVRSAMAELDRTHDRLVAETIALAEVPAPPFKERARAAAFRRLLDDAGLHAEQDAEGNVLALRRGVGRADGPVIVMAAHLDTVFPEGTDVRVSRDGTRLSGPGVGDNARSLAVLAAIARALDHAGVQTESDILFVGDVGEEGDGNLRGIRHLFTKGAYRTRIAAFVAIDGTGPGNRIIDGAVASRRFRVRFTGPGGHSFGAFGDVNPAFALAGAIDRLSQLVVPANPRTTYNVGVIGGGTSVNAIPALAWAEIDLRSESALELDRLEARFRVAMRDAASGENRTRSTVAGPIRLEIEPIGARPAGRTPSDSTLVATADAVVRALGQTPVHATGSTDANIPMSLGIPAIAIESGGDGGRVHTRDEWIDVEKTSSLRGVENALTLLLAMAGVV